MMKKIIFLLLALGITYLNIQLVSLRWSEPLASFTTPASVIPIFHGLAAGIISYALLLGLWEQLRARRWLGGVLILILGSPILYFIFGQATNPFSYLQGEQGTWCLVGLAASALALSPAKVSEPTIRTFSISKLPCFFFVSFNILLLLIPMSSLSPSFEQTPGILPSAGDINYGSIHSGIAPFYIYARSAVNALFPLPSINATAIVSAGLVALAIAFTACSVQIIFGSPWGWALVMLVATDHWAVSTGVASSIVSMPFVSSSLALILAMWALYRPRETLELKESLIVGVVGAAGTLFTIFGYAAGRIPWIIGCAVIGLILLYRGAFKLRLKSAGTLLLLIAPTVIAICAIVHTIFADSFEGFKGKIFITPPKEFLAHPDDFPGVAKRFRNPDTVIWWGTARIEGRNMTIQWLRSPAELLEEATWMVQAIAAEGVIDRSTFLLATTGLLLGLLTPLRYRSKGILGITLLTLGAALPYLIGEDPTAFRRGAYVSIGISALVVCLFAHISRPRWKLLSMCLLGAFCIIRLPLEAPALLSLKMHAPICAQCQNEVIIRNLALDPLFTSLSDRNLVFSTLEKEQNQGVRCQALAINTYEFKRLAPNATQLRIPGDELATALQHLKTGDIMVARCHQQIISTNPLCTDALPEANFLGTVPRNAKNVSAWWALHEKL